MVTITLKNDSKIDVKICSAEFINVQKLVILNHKWQKAALGDQLQDGYIGAAFSTDTFYAIIEKKQIVITEYNDEVIGYYLLNNISKDGVIGRHEEIVKELKNSGIIDKKKNICVGGQVVVDSSYMGSGIRQQMLKELVSNMKGCYDFLFGTIAKDNPRAYTAHTRDGWKVYGEDDNLFFVLYEV
ncbi:hypothetical protein GCM10011514_41310 [Emticicia aquatilis]|uniref:Uncharacterized protein n=1 Tax=Emticicia aquatilis TaxID=1537369 RepID=A0A916Z2H5_9BACT|nr:GNAT family N-acetyltransferase [Emticicia aquatilis]GGD72953.1 hypothetical protein GCM10011514_41310 [Emticicia aquatilis]